MATGTLTPFFSIGFIRTVWPALCVGSSIQSCGKSISVPFHIYRRTNSIDFFLSVFYFFTRRCPPLVLLRRFHDTTPCPFFFHINTSEAEILNKSIQVCCIRVTHCVFFFLSAEISAADVRCGWMHSCFQLTRDIDGTRENVVNYPHTKSIDILRGASCRKNSNSL